ncbi:hypothetical protein D3C78_1062630 [compost metagenome]
MTASLGTHNRLCSVDRFKRTCAVNPGLRRPSGLGSSTRTRTVRLSGFVSGRMALIVPLSTSPGRAGRRASTGWPTVIAPASTSGTATASQTLLRPLTRARVSPTATVMPARAFSSCSTPPMGLVRVRIGWALPLRSTWAINPAGIPVRRKRWRAAASSSLSPLRLIARNSSWAAAHSGINRSASAALALSTSPGARA